MNVQSGTNIYRYGEHQLEELSYFLYEVTLYRISKRKSDCISIRYYKSDKFLNIKECEVIKQLSNYKIVRFINLIGSPKQFIKDNYLKLYEKRKSRNSR